MTEVIQEEEVEQSSLTTILVTQKTEADDAVNVDL